MRFYRHFMSFYRVLQGPMTHYRVMQGAMTPYREGTCLPPYQCYIDYVVLCSQVVFS